MRRAWSLPLAAALACGRPAPAATVETCETWPRTLARAEEALTQRSDEAADAGFARVLACAEAKAAHARAQAGHDLLADADTSEVERLHAYVLARKHSPQALAQALARVRVGDGAAEGLAREFCHGWSAEPALAVLCFAALPTLDAPAIQAVLRAHAALGVLNEDDLTRLVALDPQGATLPLQQCVSAPHRALVRDGDDALGALAYRLASAADEPAARCLRRLGFEQCRRGLERGGTCPAPESVGPAIRDAAASGALLELHPHKPGLRSPIALAGKDECKDPAGVPQGALGPLLAMHLALAEVLEWPSVRTELAGHESAIATASKDLFSVRHHRECAQALYCRETDGDIAGFADHLPSSPGGASCSATRVNPPLQPVVVADRDRDAIPDAEDLCPDSPESRNGFKDDDGCPDDPDDGDGDGVRGEADHCPDRPERPGDPCPGDGCPFSPADRDGDGIAGRDDLCGRTCENYDGRFDDDGCPESLTDPDGDQVVGRLDECPQARETPNRHTPGDGCPDSEDDHDGDGVPNASDQCPDERETENHYTPKDGCPDSAIDHDGDGLRNDLDECPEERGTKGRLRRAKLAPSDGCPDGDGDGVPDRRDDCPRSGGRVDSRGCPRASKL